MDLDLKGKTVVITGAGGGIGFATASAFVDEGANVVGGDLRPEKLTRLDGPGEVLAITVDLADAAGPQRLVDQAVGRFGQIDCLVNNVAIAPTRTSFLDVDDAAWQEILNLNFLAMVRTTRAALPHMVERGSGSIVSIASDVARQPDVFFVDYSVTKAAIVSLSKSLSNEFGAAGIRSNVVTPGPTRTELWDREGGFIDFLSQKYNLDRESAVDHFAKVERRLPLGRVGDPKLVASVIVFLSSARAAQVTGADYRVDSGVISGA